VPERSDRAADFTAETAKKPFLQTVSDHHSFGSRRKMMHAQWVIALGSISESFRNICIVREHDRAIKIQFQCWIHPQVFGGFSGEVRGPGGGRGEQKA
jgi:hypothetical protein